MDTKRVVFKKDSKELFFSRILNGRNLKSFCKIRCLNYSTFKGYCKGSFTLPIDLFERLIEISGISLDDITYNVIPANWWQSSAGEKGARKLFQKYDNRVLNKWRRLGTKNSPITKPKKIRVPSKIDEGLAELVEVYLGDGTLTKYFIRISGDKRFDLTYFEYLSKLTEETFDLKPTIRAEKNKNLLTLEIRSRLLCNYFRNKFDFKIGDKIRNKSVIPQKILTQKNLFLACLRGLVDTDGSVSKDGGILSIRFTNHNTALIKQLKETPFLDGLFTIKSNPKEVGTRSFGKIKQYFSLVGSSNLRHIVRYDQYLKNNLLRKKSVLNYYSNYKNIVLPFKIS